MEAQQDLTEARLPITVVEVADTPAAAFGSALLGDFGANVIVVEGPAEGSRLRRLGSEQVQAVWWPILARNKQSLALDTSRPAALDVLDRLLAAADVLFADSSDAAARVSRHRGAESRTLVTRLFPPGADRPDLWRGSTAPELAASATGAVALTGKPDEPPVQPEIPLTDYTAAILATALTLAELRFARLNGRSPRGLDIGLHEAMMRMNEWQLVVAGVQGHAEPRAGNRFPMNANIGNTFRTRDGKLLTVSAATPSVADRLLEMIGGEALRQDPRFRTPADRRGNMDALDVIIAEWMSRHDADEAMRLVRENDVVVGPIYDASDLLANPHLQARDDIVRLPDGKGGFIAMPAALPKIEGFPGQVRSIGPAPGQGTRGILGSLGYDAGEIEQLKKAGAIWTSD